MGGNYLIYADYGAPYKGNFINSLMNLESKIKGMGSRVIFLFPDRTKNSEWVYEIIKEGHVVYFLSGNTLKDIKTIRTILKENKINNLYVHFYTSKLLAIFEIATLGMKMKKIVHLHNIVSTYNTLKKILFKILIRKWIFIGCSQATTESALKIGINQTKLNTVENAIDFSRLNTYKTLSKEDMGVNNDVKVILMFGYSYHTKGVDLAIKAIKELRLEHKLELWISVSSRLEEMKNNIIYEFGEFPSWVKILRPRNDVATYYNVADIFLSASREEGFCYSLVEAAYCQTEILASKIPAQKELNIPYSNWFDNENSTDLTNQLSKMIQSNSDMKKLKEQKEIVYETYDLSTWSLKVLKCINER